MGCLSSKESDPFTDIHLTNKESSTMIGNNWERSKVKINNHRQENIWKHSSHSENNTMSNAWQNRKTEPGLTRDQAAGNAWKASKKETKNPPGILERDPCDFTINGSTTKYQRECGRDTLDFSANGDPYRPHEQRDRFDFSVQGNQNPRVCEQERDIFDFSVKGDQSKPYWS